MNFLDGYYRTGSKIRDPMARREYYAAIIEYYYEGAEPRFEHEAAEVGFEGVFYSLDLARKRSLARSGKTKRAQSGNKPKRKAEQNGNKAAPGAEENGNKGPTKEEEEEAATDVAIPPSPPCAGFADLCLMELNGVMGTAYTAMPEKCRHVLERAEGRFSPEEVGGMVAYKRREWLGTRFRSNLTPNFLFSPDHFEQCMAQSQMAEEVGADAGLGKFAKPEGSGF